MIGRPTSLRVDRLQLAAAALLVFGTARCLALISDSPGIDYRNAWLAAAAAERGAALYDPRQHASIRESFVRASDWRAEVADAANTRLYATGSCPTGTPLLYTMLGALRSGDYERDYWVWQTVSLALFAAGIWWLGRSAGMPGAAAAVLLGLVLIYHAGLHSDLRVGNAGRLQLFLLAAMIECWRRPGLGRSAAGGWLLVATVALKPNLIAVVPLAAAGWVAAGRWRDAAAALAGGAAAVLATLGLNSAADWQQWHAYAATALSPVPGMAAGNLSWTGWLPHSAALAGWGVATGWLTLVAGRACRRSPEGRVPLPRMVALGAAASLWAPLAWIHYSLVALPLTIELFRSPAGESDQARLKRIAWATPLAIATGGFALRFCGVESMLLHSLVLHAGLVASIAFGLRGEAEERKTEVEPRRGRRARRTEGEGRSGGNGECADVKPFSVHLSSSSALSASSAVIPSSPPSSPLPLYFFPLCRSHFVSELALREQRRSVS